MMHGSAPEREALGEMLGSLEQTWPRLVMDSPNWSAPARTGLTSWAPVGDVSLAMGRPRRLHRPFGEHVPDGSATGNYRTPCGELPYAVRSGRDITFDAPPLPR